MLISENFKQIVLKRYEEIILAGVKEGIIDESLGALKLFINFEPKWTLMKFQVGEDTLFVGAND